MPTPHTTTPWLHHTSSGTGRPAHQLVIFPHAGGGPRFYRELTLALGEDVAVWVVHYPGRERRIAESMPGTLRELARAIAPEIAAHVPGPCLFLGHSMGATVAFETASLLPEQVRGLIVSASPAPHTRTRRSVHLLDDDALVAEVEGMGATPDGALTHPELRALLLPVLREDYRLIETHEPDPDHALSLPVHAYAGLQDTTASPAQMAPWAQSTTGTFSQRSFAGDHFYLQHAPTSVVEAIRADLDSCWASTGRNRD